MPNIELDDELVNQAKRYARHESRSVSEQIEHWARIAMLMEKNPKLSYDQLSTEQLLKAGIYDL